MQLLVQLDPRSSIADDKIPGLIPVVCLGVPDKSVIASVWCKRTDENGTAQLPWGSPAAQLFHNYEVSEEQILQLLRQGMHAATPQVADSVELNDDAPACSDHKSAHQDPIEPQEVPNSSMIERQSDASQSGVAGVGNEYSAIECMDQLTAPVFQAVQIEVDGRHAVVKKVMPLPHGSSPGFRLSHTASRTSSRASASSMAASSMSAATTASFQLGGKW